MGLRNDPSKDLQGDANYQLVATRNRTEAFVCGSGQQLFVVATFGPPNQQQDSSWLGLPAGVAYKELFNSSWPEFQVEFEQEQANGGYDAQFFSGQVINLSRWWSSESQFIIPSVEPLPSKFRTIFSSGRIFKFDIRITLRIVRR